MSELKENPCWFCPDYQNERCTQDSIVMRAGRPCGQQLINWLEKRRRVNPLAQPRKKVNVLKKIENLALKFVDYFCRW